MAATPRRTGGRRARSAAPSAPADGPLVSIVTPVLNGAATLERCLLSVLEQSYPHIELLIIDGGSTDATLDIIRRHEERIAWWSSGPDAGIAEAFNRGVEAASGSLIGILGSDDWYEPDAVSAVVQAWSRDPGADVLHGDMRLCEGSKPLFTRKALQPPERIWREMIYNFAACFVTREAYRRYGPYDPSYRVAMDYELLARFHARGARFLYIPKVLANMPYGGASTKQLGRTFTESYRATIALGYPRSKALFWLALKLLKTFVRRAAGLGQGSRLVLLYRRWAGWIAADTPS